MTTLLQHLPKPLLEDFSQARWLPIVGAGFSRNSSVPAGDPPVTWPELGARLASDLQHVEPSAGTLEVISAYEHEFDRQKLVDRTATLIRAYDAQPSGAHEAFASIGQFPTVVTTNFDFLLERSYERLAKRCMPVLEEAQLSAMNRGSGPRVIKMHGDVHHPDRMVLTEDDYDSFLIANPIMATTVTALLVEYTPVLIGYSLDDPDTRQLLSLMRSRLGRMARTLWSIQVDANANTIARFARRGVKVVNLPRRRGAAIGDQFQLLFEELETYARQAVRTDGIATDEKVAEELNIPADSSLICYFAVPARSVAWYRETVFPLVESRGLVPTTARDVLTPNGTIATKVDALVEKAACVVIEEGSPWSDYEAALARSRKPNSNVLTIASSPTATERLGVFPILRKPTSTLEEDIFRGDFELWLSNVQIVERQMQREPERLLEKGEFAAAVVAAVTTLEVALRQSTPPSANQLSSGRTEPLSSLLETARRTERISDAELTQLRAAIRTRNEILHTGGKVSAREARELTEATLTIARRLRA